VDPKQYSQTLTGELDFKVVAEGNGERHAVFVDHMVMIGLGI